MIEVTFLPILVAGIAVTIFGSLWYSPYVFGTMWMRDAGITPEMAERGKRRMGWYVFLAFLGAMLIAYVMNYFGISWGVYDWIGALELAFWCWAGFTLPVLLSSVLWEHKPFRYFLINSIYWLVAFVVIAFALLFV